MLCDCEIFAKVRCELLCSAVQSSHFTVNVSSKMVLGGRSGVVVPWPGVCRGTSQCCSESEHWRGCSTDSWASDGRQQPSCSLSPSGDLSLSSANLLTHTKNQGVRERPDVAVLCAFSGNTIACSATSAPSKALKLRPPAANSKALQTEALVLSP